MISDKTFSIANKSTGARGVWPANVPLVITHAGEMWAVAPTGEVTITSVFEYLTD